MHICYFYLYDFTVQSSYLQSTFQLYQLLVSNSDRIDVAKIQWSYKIGCYNNVILIFISAVRIVLRYRNNVELGRRKLNFSIFMTRNSSMLQHVDWWFEGMYKIGFASMYPYLHHVCFAERLCYSTSINSHIQVCYLILQSNFTERVTWIFALPWYEVCMHLYEYQRKIIRWGVTESWSDVINWMWNRYHEC